MTNPAELAPTPETDAAVNAGGQQLLNVAECARKLERQRDALAEALRPFAALNLGPAGYCSLPLADMIEEAKAALAQLGEGK